MTARLTGVLVVLGALALAAHSLPRTLDEQLAGVEAEDRLLREWDAVESHRALGTLPSMLQELLKSDPSNATALAALAELYLLGEEGIDIDEKRGLEYALKAADLGHPVANYLVAFALRTGRGGSGAAWPPSPEAEEDAFVRAWFASRGYHVPADLALGYWHQTGRARAQQSCDIARDFLMVASEEHVKTLDPLQPFIESGHRRLTAFELVEWPESSEQSTQDNAVVYQYLANIGNVHASMVLGHAHAYGLEGAAVDYEAAREHYANAIAQADALEADGQAQDADRVGAAEAHYGLGRLYEKGLGVAQSNATALQHYRKAQSMRYSLAITRLALAKLRGELGMEVSVEPALAALRGTAEAGGGAAAFVLGDVYAGIERVEGVAVDEARARNYYTMASLKGNVVATHELAKLSPSCDVAVVLFRRVAERSEWLEALLDRAEDFVAQGLWSLALARYELAALAGVEVAQSSAAWLYERGLGLPASAWANATHVNDTARYLRAVDYLEASAAQASAAGGVGKVRVGGLEMQGHSYVRLGDLYYYGRGVAVDMAKALQCYQSAAGLNNPQALFAVATMYHTGAGLPVDLNMAKRYYDLAAQNGAAMPARLALVALRAQMLAQRYNVSRESAESWAFTAVALALATLLFYRFRPGRR
eukprot:m51a1_g1516 putative C-tail anchored protein, Sel-1 repeat (652) ;mRNA; f:425569-428598